jgi:hypothetical protein
LSSIRRIRSCREKKSALRSRRREALNSERRL